MYICMKHKEPPIYYFLILMPNPSSCDNKVSTTETLERCHGRISVTPGVVEILLIKTLVKFSFHFSVLIMIHCYLIS
jgi:hypothetical protein